jgi:hypothetical protein
VIGGLIFATFATLVFVPIMFRLLPHKARATSNVALKGNLRATT